MHKPAQHISLGCACRKFNFLFLRGEHLLNTQSQTLFLFTKLKKLNVSCFNQHQTPYKNMNIEDRQCMCTHNIEAHSCNHCLHGKAMIIKYSECVFVDLVIQHVMCMCCIILSSVACLALPYFSALSH
jgi:hypothetical protein